MGLDGQSKMSKSMGNTIGLLESTGGDLGQAAPGRDRPQTNSQNGSGHARSMQHLSFAQRLQSAERRSSTSRRSAAPRAGAVSTARRCWPNRWSRSSSPSDAAPPSSRRTRSWWTTRWTAGRLAVEFWRARRWTPFGIGWVSDALRSRTGARHEPCILGGRSRRRPCCRALPARMKYLRGSFLASHAVPQCTTRANQGLESESTRPSDADPYDLQFFRSHGVDPSRGDTARGARVQPVRQLWNDAPGQRDALRRVRAETEQAGASVLSAGGAAPKAAR